LIFLWCAASEAGSQAAYGPNLPYVGKPIDFRFAVVPYQNLFMIAEKPQLRLQ
jgi:hypothetical protein